MVIISHNDARALFLGIAQLIPLFLIALFVMDNAWVSTSLNEAKTSMAAALEKAAKMIKDQESEVERTTENKLKELEDFAETYGTSGARSAAANTRAEMLSLADDFRTQSKATLDGLSKSLADIVEREEVAVRKRASIFARLTIAAIVPGMLGEIASLWGAAGLADDSVIIAFATAVIVFIAGVLSVLAVERLITEPKSGLLSIFRPVWILALGVATLTTFIWILLSVQVRS